MISLTLYKSEVILENMSMRATQPKNGRSKSKCSVKGHNYKFFPLDFPNLGQLVNAQVISFLKKGFACGYRTQYWLKEVLIRSISHFLDIICFPISNI